VGYWAELECCEGSDNAHAEIVLVLRDGRPSLFNWLKMPSSQGHLHSVSPWILDGDGKEQTSSPDQSVNQNIQTDVRFSLEH